MAVPVRVEERFRVGDEVALPIGEDRGLVGTVVSRTNPAIYKTPDMKYLVEFKDLPRSVSTALLSSCSCDQCARSDRKIAKQGARGPQLDALLAERRASCKSDGILPSGNLRIWLGKWQILNFTGKNRLPYFTI